MVACVDTKDPGACLAKDEVVWAEDLAKWTRAHTVHRARLLQNRKCKIASIKRPLQQSGIGNNVDLLKVLYRAQVWKDYQVHEDGTRHIASCKHTDSSPTEIKHDL